MVVLHMVEEMPSISASTMPASATGGPMAADDVGPPIIPSTPSQDAFAGIFSGANPQSIESLIEEMKRAARAQAAAAAAQESAWKDIAAYYKGKVGGLRCISA